MHVSTLQVPTELAQEQGTQPIPSAEKVRAVYSSSSSNVSTGGNSKSSHNNLAILRCSSGARIVIQCGIVSACSC